METVVPAALDEITTAITTIAPAHEGLRDFSRLNLQRSTQEEVLASLQQYDRRLQLLTTAKAGIDALLKDGYPDLVPRKIADAALQDLAANEATIAAALKQFTSNAPTTLNLSASATEPK